MQRIILGNLFDDATRDDVTTGNFIDIIVLRFFRIETAVTSEASFEVSLQRTEEFCSESYSCQSSSSFTMGLTI